MATVTTFTAEKILELIEDLKLNFGAVTIYRGISNGIIKISNPNAFDVYGDGTYIMRSHWEGG